MKLNKLKFTLIVSLTSFIGGCALVDRVEELIKPEEVQIEQRLTEQKMILGHSLV